MDQKVVYTLEDKIYINLTNRCTNRCIFCIRNVKDDVMGSNLWLANDAVTSDEVINQLENYKNRKNPSKLIFNEVVFCGYGEPTLKLPVLKEVAKYIKENYDNVKIRLNTNGHANFVFKRNILPELKGLVDDISVSLNAPNERIYKELSQPNIRTEAPLEVVKDFIKASVESGFSTTASVVSGYKGYDVKVPECEKIAQDLGAKFRNREWLENGY